MCLGAVVAILVAAEPGTASWVCLACILAAATALTIAIWLGRR